MLNETAPIPGRSFSYTCGDALRDTNVTVDENGQCPDVHPTVLSTCCDGPDLPAGNARVSSTATSDGAAHSVSSPLVYLLMSIFVTTFLATLGG